MEHGEKVKPKFEWDDSKNRLNRKKHGVDFEEASTIFTSFPLEIFYDPDHSIEEARYIAAGISSRHRILLVVHCENLSGSTIRIISARKATKKEARDIFGGIR